MTSNLQKVLYCHARIILFCATALLYNCKTIAQTYSNSLTFGNASQYSFDYTIVCDDPATSATLTITFTTAPPTDLVPQLHLGAGVFVSMSGTGPYTYDFTGLTDCDFSFYFYLAYFGSGLYQSPSPVTADNTPLPIFLSSFKVIPHDISSAELKWVSESEINSHYFRIERSSDALNWDYVDDVSAAGNSSSSISYRFVDQELPVGREPLTVVYYRLKMVDLDGTYEYSEIRAFNVAAMLDDEVSIYPNPAQDRLMVDLTSIANGSENIELGIYNAMGNKVIYKQLEDSTVEEVNLSDLPPATYQLLIFRNGKVSAQSPLIKVH